MGQARVDIVIVGAGILGINQLYRARQDGYSVQLLEQGDGAGGTWYWNRYPGCRFDSESYTYGYLFSPELWRDWEWTEEFAGQPETERYVNHVVDRFGLRESIRFGSKVVAADWDEESRTWTTRTEDGHVVQSTYLVSATGVLSVPFYPDIPGRETFTGEQYHTGRWPAEPVELAGKRVAVIGTGSSGVQVAPLIADEAASLTVYQRTPSWCTPLNNHPISAEQQAELKGSYEKIRDALAVAVAGFLHEPSGRKTFEDSKDDRWAFYETIWNSPGFAKMSSNYDDMVLDPKANKEWCDFLEEKIRGIVADQSVADRLVPDHGYGALRPPFVAGFYEMFNKPNVELVSTRQTPFVRITPTGIETTDGLREFDLVVWATGFDFGTGAMLRMGIRGVGGLSLNEYWSDGPRTFLGVMCHQFPNFFFPGGPHGAAGNNPRYGGDQVDFVADLLNHARERGETRVEVPLEVEERWADTMAKALPYSSFVEHGQYYGENVPGKPRRFLLNPAGRPVLLRVMTKTAEGDYAGFLA
ncbi:flavin-containing monooxygenase [Pseudofrankia inefficax]|uniref:Phenylacetone monooxygenase n=1 Tax=Pseudofrankia inefficax (strain DSM 45817 / CECT 9037 / DDB 130130 / EuI1c) TaxID=298654 RepID=E3J8C0_PSEI1|nr:NAD(P)/FAD-dependent oxidoreductase [Pseudofrankia inefficax]ADP83313.1 Phenylacetone monooxygenase [Pseudofrankia inefficax]